MQSGKIKWFDPVKGIGFVKGDDDKDYFVHVSGVRLGRTMVGFQPDDPVTFNLKHDLKKRGDIAVDVSLISEK